MTHTTTIQNVALVATADFAGEYAALLQQHDPARNTGFIDFEELMLSVKLLVEAHSTEGASDEMLEFEDFQDFFEWYERHTAYDQMAPENMEDFFKLLLDVVYRALVAEYAAMAQAEAFVEDTPEATMQVVERLKAMHPELLWGTIELGDYNQYADIDAPAVLIYFSKHFYTNREEMPDAYADFCGNKFTPAQNGVSDAAAKLLREHNKINFIRDIPGKKAAWVFKTIEGVEAAHALAGMLLTESAAFTCTPLPDDFYEFSVKTDRQDLFAKAQ